MSTYLSTLRELLSEDVGDVIFGSCDSTTTATGATTYLYDSALIGMPSDWLRTGSGGEQPTWVKLTSGTYSGSYRAVSAFDNTTGKVTWTTALAGAVASAVTYELHKLCHPALKDDCISKAIKDSYPYLYSEVDSLAYRFGNWLIDGDFEDWSSSSALTYYTASSATLTRTSTAGYVHSDTYSCKIVTSSTTGGIYQNISNNKDLLFLGGSSVTLGARVLSSNASEWRAYISYTSAGTTTTVYSDYHSGGGGFELLEVTTTIGENPSAVVFGIISVSTAMTAYVDDMTVTGPEKYDYDISNLSLVNNVPERIYSVASRSGSTPKPKGQTSLLDCWAALPGGIIRFTQSLGSTKLRITGKKYLATSGTADVVAAGATFLDLTDTDDTSYTGKAGYFVAVNTGETGLELSSSSASAHAIGSDTHTADTWADFIALISDEVPMSVTSNLDNTAAGTNGNVAKGITTNAFYDHNAATTGVHGASTNTLMNTGDNLDNTSGGTDSSTTKGITSGVHYAHCQAADPHVGYVLEASTDASGYSFVTDEDDMTSDLATKVPTEQSVKAYVDAKVSDAAYDESTWDAVTTIAPSKNAVRDKIEAMIAVSISDTAYGVAWDGQTTVAPSQNATYDMQVAHLAASDPHTGYVTEASTDASDYSFVIDEDNLASDDDTKVPTQQSVKAYVDAQVASTMGDDALWVAKGDMAVGTGEAAGARLAIGTDNYVLRVATDTPAWEEEFGQASLTTLLGNVLAENDAIKLDAALSADGKYNGIVRSGTAGAVLAFGDLCYLAVADSRWELADADSEAKTFGLLGICVLAAAGDGSATNMLLLGIVRADTAFPSFTVGAPVYVSTTDGDVTNTAPSGSGDCIRAVGQAWTADELLFKPDNHWFEHA